MKGRSNRENILFLPRLWAIIRSIFNKSWLRVVNGPLRMFLTLSIFFFIPFVSQDVNVIQGYRKQSTFCFSFYPRLSLKCQFFCPVCSLPLNPRMLAGSCLCGLIPQSLSLPDSMSWLFACVCLFVLVCVFSTISHVIFLLFLPLLLYSLPLIHISIGLMYPSCYYTHTLTQVHAVHDVVSSISFKRMF